MSKILIIYSTTDGHTRNICRRLCQVVEQLDYQITLISIDDESNVDLKSFDKIILGASIRYLLPVLGYKHNMILTLPASVI